MTQPTRQQDIKRDWHLIDLKGKTLGRVATQIASLLMGKNKPYFVRNLDCGDYIVAINAKEIAVSGKKETAKKYYRHSGYPHGMKVTTLANVRETNPSYIITHAVKGMLPQNRLLDQMLKRLYVFPSQEHPYKEKIKQ